MTPNMIFALSLFLTYASGAWMMAWHLIPARYGQDEPYVLWQKWAFTILWPVVMLLDAAFWGLIFFISWACGWKMLYPKNSKTPE